MEIGSYLIMQGKPYIVADQGLVLCDGGLVSRRRNPQLYALISTQYTDEDRRCTTCDLFCVPDLLDP